MMEFHKLTYSEYIDNLKIELWENCLYKTVKQRCDNISFQVSTLGYSQRGFIQEQLDEILELIMLAERKEE